MNIKPLNAHAHDKPPVHVTARAYPTLAKACAAYYKPRPRRCNCGRCGR